LCRPWFQSAFPAKGKGREGEKETLLQALNQGGSGTSQEQAWEKKRKEGKMEKMKEFTLAIFLAPRFWLMVTSGRVHLHHFLTVN